ILVNALIFAVLAAAVALAYYSYSFVTSEASREREERLMRDLAEEKVFSIEDQILRDNAKLFGSRLPFDAFVAQLHELTKGLRFMSVFVLDDRLEIVPSGYYSQREVKEGAEFREWFEKAVVPNLHLASLPVGE